MVMTSWFTGMWWLGGVAVAIAVVAIVLVASRR